MNIIPFDTPELPAILGRRKPLTSNKLVGNSSSDGFPVISIKGKVFHIQRGDERTLITKPGEEDPAASIEVVVIDVNPDKSKVFYANGYQEGEKAKPTCYSNSGIAPEADADEPQSKKCATCAHNQWGSRITDNGGKGKACSDSRRVAIATPDTPADPMLMRVPAASMKAMEEYGKLLAARGVEPFEVVTKIGFDYSVAHPALTFRPVGIIGDAEQLEQIKAAAATDIVAKIIGVKPVSETEQAVDEPDAPAAQAPAPAPVAVAPRPVAAKPAIAKAAAPKADVSTQIDKAMAAASTTKKVAVAVEAAPVQDTSGLEAQIGGLMDSMDFDD
jgi:hypothetical protein